jgi:hypothetical protein
MKNPRLGFKVGLSKARRGRSRHQKQVFCSRTLLSPIHALARSSSAHHGSPCLVGCQAYRPQGRVGSLVPHATTFLACLHLPSILQCESIRNAAPSLLALGRLRQEDGRFEASLGYMETIPPCYFAPPPQKKATQGIRTWALKLRQPVFES